MENKTKSIVSAVAATAFVAAAYYLPIETFLALFAGGLFLVPASFFVYLIHTLAKSEEHT